jgi:HAD superfamily hydrolase (TIGR01662 family)
VPYAVVIPTIGRACLADCLTALADSRGPGPEEIVVVDDRPGGGPPLEVPGRVVGTGGRGPAAARNAGWRETSAPWVVFLDDDVRVTQNWAQDLRQDLTKVAAEVGGVQGRITVPLPVERRATDWERGTAGLAEAWWITADIAYRRDTLVETGGFDERFPRAFREDADLALRAMDAGWVLTKGRRRTVHPVRVASRWASARAQAGNADDALMRAVHGPGWHTRAKAAPGRRARHLAITATAALAAGLAVAGRPKAAAVAGGAGLAGVAEFAAARITPGPRTRDEILTMAATSVLIPPLATWHWLRGLVAARGQGAWPGPAKAVLFDRDNTLIRDVPYNGDPDKVTPMPGAAEAVELARRSGLRVGVVSNQSGIARGLLTADQVALVNKRVEELLGPFDTWQICPHAGGCPCRKPAPGLITQAADALGLRPEECVVVGDIGSDVAAARAAGARSVLIPTAETLPAELLGARVAASLTEAVRFALGHHPAHHPAEHRTQNPVDHAGRHQSPAGRSAQSFAAEAAKSAVVEPPQTPAEQLGQDAAQHPAEAPGERSGQVFAEGAGPHSAQSSAGEPPLTPAEQPGQDPGQHTAEPPGERRGQTTEHPVEHPERHPGQRPGESR